MEHNTIQLELTVAEANLILSGLGQQPYIKVTDLIEKIQQQGVSQLKSEKANTFVEDVEQSEILVEDG